MKILGSDLNAAIKFAVEITDGLMQNIFQLKSLPASRLHV